MIAHFIYWYDRTPSVKAKLPVQAGSRTPVLWKSDLKWNIFSRIWCRPILCLNISSIYTTVHCKFNQWCASEKGTSRPETGG